jgi:hypothetical protein
MVNDPFISITDRTIMARETSYEIVCATARSAPIRAYLELDDQPKNNLEMLRMFSLCKAVVKCLGFGIRKPENESQGFHVFFAILGK